MKNKVLAVYDADPYYADRFADLVNQREQVPFTVIAFTLLPYLMDYAQTNEVEILLISNQVENDVISRIRASLIILLEDGTADKHKEQYPSVFKYQSAENVIREIMSCYSKIPAEEIATLLGPASSIIGVYSPVNRCQKTSFALTLGQLKAKDSKALYMNFEECSGFSEIIGCTHEGNLSDILYYYNQNSYNWVKLSSVVHSWQGLDYIPPVRYPEDLLQIKAEEITELLLKIAKESIYDVLILDIGQMGKQAAEVLEICDLVYMPIKGDCVSLAKIKEFEEYLEVSGHTALKERLQKLRLPDCIEANKGGQYMEHLLWSELGDYVRQLLG